MHLFHLHFMNEAQVTPPVMAEPALNLKGSCIYDENLMGILSFSLPLMGRCQCPFYLALSEPMLVSFPSIHLRAELSPCLGMQSNLEPPAAVFQLVLGQ